MPFQLLLSRRDPVGPGPGDQPLQVPGEPLGGLLVISPDGLWRPPALILRPRGQEWAAVQERCCCSQKDLWCPWRPPDRGATPARATPICRSSLESQQLWFSTHPGVARGPTHPRLGNKKVTWLDAGATAASDHPGAELHRGSAGWVCSGLSSQPLPPSEYQAHLSGCTRPFPAPDTGGRRSAQQGNTKIPALPR